MQDSAEIRVKRLKKDVNSRTVRNIMDDEPVCRDDTKFRHRLYCVKDITPGGSKKIYSLTPREVLAERGILLDRTIGKGTYSTVKLAKCMKRGSVAVKIISRRKGSTLFWSKFLPRELDIWRKLKHPNIIKMYASFRDSRFVYMVLQYASQGDVLTYIQDRGALDEVGSRKWSFQIIDAITYLHNLNIAHRDLKLENIVIDDGFNVKICDFGFVKENCHDSLTDTFCGSITYAPPEILRAESYEPTKSDIWSLGVIIFIMNTGTVPFDGADGIKSVKEAQLRMDFNWDNLVPLSDDCRALIYYIFEHDFHLRPTIYEVRRHIWFCSANIASDNSNSTVQDRVGNTVGTKSTKRRRPYHSTHTRRYRYIYSDENKKYTSTDNQHSAPNLSYDCGTIEDHGDVLSDPAL